jgi:hypothetical protein
MRNENIRVMKIQCQLQENFQYSGVERLGFTSGFSVVYLNSLFCVICLFITSSSSIV